MVEKMNKGLIEQILKLKEEGLKIIEIAKKLGISKNTVYYYTDPEFRKRVLSQAGNWFKNLPKERRSMYYKMRLPYLRDYQKKRYQTDEAFRIKHLESVKQSKSRHSNQ